MQTATIDRTKRWTVDDYLLLGESVTPCELINSELVMSPAPSPSHQESLSNLNDFFKAASKLIGGKTFFAPIDLYINTKNVFQPDLLVLLKDKLSYITERGVEGPPDIIVEIISPCNVFTDRNTKKKTYLEFGVKEYWIVDPANKTLEIYLSTQANYDTPYFYLVKEGKITSTVLTEMSFDLKEVFI